MPLIIDSPDRPERALVVTAVGLDAPDPRIGPNAEGKEVTVAENTVKVRALMDHQDGATWHPKGEEYSAEPMRAKDKASRGIVAIVSATEKAERATADKSIAPPRNKGGRKAKL